MLIRGKDHYGCWVCKDLDKHIILDCFIPLRVFDQGFLSVIRYEEKIVEPHVRLFRSTVGSEFLLIDDHAYLHKTQLVNGYLESEDIRCMN
ncbi:hypothetical protein TNCV_4940141 [Trichonephila clavipes]|nr:hypothetical protein TNCV_4940141 [Trichonephila clavipes]